MYQNNKKILSLLLLLFTGWHGVLSAALPQLPIKISSDSIYIDKKKGLSHFKGNVEINQGKLKMKAQDVRVYINGKDIEKVLIEGEPVILEHNSNGMEVKAQANRIEFIADSGILNLTGNVKLKKGLQEFSGEHIQYNRDTQQVSAKGNGDLKSRVKAVILPGTSESK